MSDPDARGDEGVDLDGYCRAVEAHLCRKNDGHLIRVAGPAFDLVRGWAEQGVPLKVALAGIDRTFERYYRKGARRRPLHVSFCDADVLDVFDDWRRALGLPSAAMAETAGPSSHVALPHFANSGEPDHAPRGASLPAHLERVANRLTLLRGDPRHDAAMDAALAGAALQMDAERQAARQARGSARAALITRLEAVDHELLAHARASLGPERLQALLREAVDALEPFRQRMPPGAYEAAREAAVTRLVREQAGLPIIRYDRGEG